MITDKPLLGGAKYGSAALAVISSMFCKFQGGYYGFEQDSEYSGQWIGRWLNLLNICMPSFKLSV